MVTLKNRFRGVKQNLKRARAYWGMKIWRRVNKRNKLKFYNLGNKKKYNANDIRKKNTKQE